MKLTVPSQYALLFVAIAMTACNVENTRDLATAAWDTITAAPSATIGDTDGAEEYLFGRIVAVAADDRGVVYVADAFGSSVRAFDRSGQFLGVVGREGDGPGEFRYVRDVWASSSGLLFVRGAFRISAFALRESAPYADSLVRELPVRGIDSPPGTRSKSIAGTVLVPTYRYENFLIRGFFYVAIDSTGAVVDTLWVPPFPNPEYSGRATYAMDDQGRGPGVEGVNRAPFEPYPSWDTSPEGHVLVSDVERYRITEVNALGDTVRILAGETRSVLVPLSVWEDSTRAFRARLDSIPVPLEQVRGMSPVARSGEPPTMFPEILALLVAPDGSVWVKRWSDEGATIFDVFLASGERWKTVRVPANLAPEPVPWLSREVIVGVVRDTATQTDRVAVFDVGSS